MAVVSNLEAAFPRLLVDDATLIALDLSGRRISSEGLGCLADVLRLVNKSLRTLNLSKNSICCKGAQKLASALEVNGHVKSLKLAHNDIGDDGAACLARMLERNTSLTELNLSYNPIGNKGALELIGSLRSDSALTSIDVSFNTIDDKGILAAGLLLKARPFPPQFRLLGIKLATCWQGLDLPSEARDWENEAILSLFRKLQNSVCPQEIVIDACVSSRLGCPRNGDDFFAGKRAPR